MRINGYWLGLGILGIIDYICQAFNFYVSPSKGIIPIIMIIGGLGLAFKKEEVKK